MPADSVAHRWRRFLRFSMRGLIVLVLLIAIGMGWLVRSAQIQRDAVAAIHEAGGQADYHLLRDTAGTTWAPNWLVAYVGIDYFDHIRQVTLNQDATDAELANVARLSGLEYISASSTRVTDKGLEYVDTPSTRVTDKGLVCLSGLTTLQSLELPNSRITDAGLAQLNGMTNLGLLDISGCQITDIGLAHLKGLTKLGGLLLDDTSVTDAGLVHLKGLTNLGALYLRSTQVTDEGVNQLRATLPKLKIAH